MQMKRPGHAPGHFRIRGNRDFHRLGKVRGGFFNWDLLEINEGLIATGDGGVGI